MARRAQPVALWPGIVAAICVATTILSAMAAVALWPEPGSGLGKADWSAIRFTVSQALLSAAISVILAIPVARALARRDFAGRALLVTLLGAPFILPVIVAILGILQVFGRNGWISQILIAFGFEPVQIYGLHGVVLAHVFFNLPLATRLLLQGWQDIPAEQFRLAATLGAGPRASFRLLEWPMLKRLLPGAFAIIFAICLTSFAVALTLGGGPRATTIELAIYQAFRFDFDLGRAAVLSLVQMALTLAAGLGALAVTRQDGFSKGMGRPVQRWDAHGPLARALDSAIITLAALFLLAPLSAILLAGLGGVWGLDLVVFRAALTSIIVSLSSVCLLMAMALPMALTAAGGRSGLAELVGLLGLAVSPLVIGTGLFILINPVADPFALALPVTALVNAVMALPFALRILIPRAREIIATEGRLALSLGMQGRPFLRLVMLDRLRPQIGFAAGLGAALSMGDLGVIAMFADPERATLPLQIYRLMGAYRMDAAAGAALILLALSLALFWIFDHKGRRHADP